MARDPLYRDEPLPYTARIPVLGVPIEFATNDDTLGAVIADTFALWKDCPVDPDAPVVHARFTLHDGDEGGRRGPVRYRMPDDRRVFIHTPGSFALADPRARVIEAYVTRELLDDTEHFRYAMLEAATFAVVSHCDRQPFHAAALVRDETVLLLYGPSGAGKSTLTYAAVESGYSVLAEDMVYLQSRLKLRVWGAPSSIHLSETARVHFPELATRASVRLANGKEKIAVRIDSGAAAPRRAYDRAVLCVIGARADAARIERITCEQALDDVAREREDGFDVFTETIRGPLSELTRTGCWRLTTSQDPRDSLPLLRGVFDAIS